MVYFRALGWRSSTTLGQGVHRHPTPCEEYFYYCESRLVSLKLDELEEAIATHACSKLFGV